MAEQGAAAAVLDPLIIQRIRHHTGGGLPVEAEFGQLFDDLGHGLACAQLTVDIALQPIRRDSDRARVLIGASGVKHQADLESFIVLIG